MLIPHGRTSGTAGVHRGRHGAAGAVGRGVVGFVVLGVGIHTPRVVTAVAENVASSIANDCAGDPLDSRDYNYIQTADCSPNGTTTHNVTGGDPLLGPLQGNGGPTFTRALWAGSPAIDQIPPGLCRNQYGAAPVPDQRGVSRPAGPLCDIGAYEGAVPPFAYNRNLVRNGDAESGGASLSGSYVGAPNWAVTSGHFTVAPYNGDGFPSVQSS